MAERKNKELRAGRISISMPIQTAEKFKIACANKNVIMSRVLSDFILDFIKREERRFGKIKFNHIILLLLSVIMLSNLASAGLVLNNSVLSVNKTGGVNYPVTLVLTNTEAYNFTNVAFESNSYINMTPTTILPGQTISIGANVISDAIGAYQVRLKGFYNANVGPSNVTRIVNISSYNEPSVCDLTITQGDTMLFSSSTLSAVTIRNRDSGIAVAALTNGQTYSQTFTSPMTFRYSLDVSGFIFASCDVTVISSSGLVNDPSKDAILNLSIATSYAPTTLDLTLLNANFTMNFYDTKDGVVLVTNTGNQTAYGVTLANTWMTFNPNSFNLAVGETKGIVFTISPLITQTSETNLTYNRSIIASGNFPSVSRNVSIFVNYGNINFAQNSSRADIDYLLNFFCPKYPYSVLCNGTGQQVIYKYLNNATDNKFNVTMSEQQVKDLWLYMIAQGDDIKTTNNYVKAAFDNITAMQSESVIHLGNIENSTKTQADAVNSNITNIYVFVLIAVSAVCIVILLIMVWRYRRKKVEDKLRRWTA